KFLSDAACDASFTPNHAPFAPSPCGSSAPKGSFLRMTDPWSLEKLTLRNGLRMRVARTGRGDPLVVMLHGFPECWYSWRHQLLALSPPYECVAPEMRGYGETDAPRGVENYRIEKLVDDVAARIERLGRKRAVIVGHDWGGAVAWAT